MIAHENRSSIRCRWWGRKPINMGTILLSAGWCRNSNPTSRFYSLWALKRNDFAASNRTGPDRPDGASGSSFVQSRQEVKV